MGSHAIISAGAVIRDHIEIGARAFIGMGALVAKNIDSGKKFYGLRTKSLDKAPKGSIA